MDRNFELLLQLPGSCLGGPHSLFRSLGCSNGAGRLSSGCCDSRMAFGDSLVDSPLGFLLNPGGLPLSLVDSPLGFLLKPRGLPLSLGGLLPGGCDLPFGRSGDLGGQLLGVRSSLLQLQCNVGVDTHNGDLLDVVGGVYVDLLVIILLESRAIKVNLHGILGGRRTRVRKRRGHIPHIPIPSPKNHHPCVVRPLDRLRRMLRSSASRRSSGRAAAGPRQIADGVIGGSLRFGS